MKSFLWVVCGFLLWTAAPVMGADFVEVVYDRSQDRISLRAKDATLSQLFAQVAQKSGIESRIDPAVSGDRLSVDQPLGPTTEVFQRLLGNYSYTLHYRAAARNKKYVSAVAIVGSGKVGNLNVHGEHPKALVQPQGSMLHGQSARDAGGLARPPDGTSAWGATQAPPALPQASGGPGGAPGSQETTLAPQATDGSTTASGSAGTGAGVPALVSPPTMPAKCGSFAHC